MITFAFIGGLLLNVGAYLTYKGKIYESVIVYLFADICWIFMAFERNDFWGAVSIFIGVSFAFLAFIKMRSGEMNKSLNNKESE